MTESAIQRAIVSTLKKLGYFVARMQSGKVKVKNGWMSLAPEGTADLLAIKGRKTLWIECKREKGKQSEAQRDFEKLVKNAGHDYVVARGVEDVTG